MNQGLGSGRKPGMHTYVPPHNTNNAPPLATETSSESRRGVTDLLHNLRGEQFRHSQNLQRTRTAHSQSNVHVQNASTLPIHLIYSEDAARDPEQNTVPSPTLRSTPGPGSPKSWRVSSENDKATNCGPAWHARALSLIFPRLPSSPDFTSSVLSSALVMPSAVYSVTASSALPLSLLCFRILLSVYSDLSDFANELVPSLPPHLRRDLLRYTAVHCPLSNSKLYALCEEGNADGELIIVGPYASLKTDLVWNRHKVRAGSVGNDISEVHEEEAQSQWSWDAPVSYNGAAATTLQTLILLSIPLTIPNFLTFPPTLTHLALIDLPSSIPIHRLPGICPLLVVLDFSFNKWIGREGPGEKALERVEWSRWRRLEVLGLRGCRVNAVDLKRVNRGRWTDVQIILDL